MIPISGSGTLSRILQRTISASPQTGFLHRLEQLSILDLCSKLKASTIETLPSQDSVLPQTSASSPQVEIEHNASRGSVSGEGSNFDSNQKTTISAQPLPNYDFSGWTINKTLSYSVTRQSSSINPSSNKLFIDNHESPALSLIRGFTYEFDCNLEDTDLFYISSDANATRSMGRIPPGHFEFEVLKWNTFLYRARECSRPVVLLIKWKSG